MMNLRRPRFAELLPLAERYGAAADNLLMIDEETELPIGTVLVRWQNRLLLLRISCCSTRRLCRFIRRDHVLPRVNGVEFCEDVIAIFSSLTASTSCPSRHAHHTYIGSGRDLLPIAMHPFGNLMKDITPISHGSKSVMALA